MPAMRARVAPKTFITTASWTRRCWVASMAPASTSTPARMLRKPITRLARPILPSTLAAVSMASRMRTTVTLGNWSVTVLKIASSAPGVDFTVARNVCGALSRMPGE